MSAPLLNVKLGPSTNSSSTHAIVIVPAGQKPPEDDYGLYFGGDSFTAASTNVKGRWLQNVVAQSLHQQGLADVYVEAVLGSMFSKGAIGERPSVDHQSVPVLPLVYGSDTHRSLDMGFIHDLEAFLSRSDVVIVGGNDNGDDEPPNWVGDLPRPLIAGVLPVDGSVGDFVCRHEGNAVWTLFRQRDSTRLTVDLGSFTQSPDFHPATPCLVDVKITNRCSFGCAFCYQGSVPTGRTAKLSIYDVARTLGEARVFEVAIGGGEPTQDKDFDQWLDTFRYNGITAHFTTRDLLWLEDPSRAQKYLQGGTSFAYSTETPEGVLRLGDAWDNYLRECAKNRYVQRPSVQIIHGMTDVVAMARACEDARLPLTILDYKTTGRGEAAQPPQEKLNDLSWWPVLVKETPCRISVDTGFARRLEAAGCLASTPRVAYARTEGASSCYIDAVEGYIARSSYEGKGGVRLPWKSGPGFIDAFQQLQAGT